MKLFRCAILVVALLATPVAIAADRDSDGIDDTEDNCLELFNPSQCDTDGDGFGNHCDADLDNNCIVNSFDLSEMRQSFGQTGSQGADLDCNGTVNSFDLARMRAAYGSIPGPSTVSTDACALSDCENPRVMPMRLIESPFTGPSIPLATQTVTACAAGGIGAGGTIMRVETQGLTPGDAYTMWFGWFENPHACNFPPPYIDNGELKCGTVDVYMTEPDSSFIYGDSLVATGTNDVFEAVVIAGVDPKGAPFTGMDCGDLGEPPCTDCGGPGQDPCQCIDGICKSDWVLMTYDDEDTGILTHPTGAEYHTVLLNKGKTEQATGALSEIPPECLPAGEGGPIAKECVTGLLFSEPGSFVLGRGSGMPAPFDPAQGPPTMEVEMAVQHRDLGACASSPQGVGICRVEHYLDGELQAIIHADINCVSAPNTIAYATGNITRIESYAVNLDEYIDTRIAITVQDTTGVSDVVKVNFPDFALLEGVSGLPNLPGNENPVDGCGCEEGIATMNVTPEDGNYWVSD